LLFGGGGRSVFGAVLGRAGLSWAVAGALGRFLGSRRLFPGVGSRGTNPPAGASQTRPQPLTRRLCARGARGDGHGVHHASNEDGLADQVARLWRGCVLREEGFRWGWAMGTGLPTRLHDCGGFFSCISGGGRVQMGVGDGRGPAFQGAGERRAGLRAAVLASPCPTSIRGFGGSSWAGLAGPSVFERPCSLGLRPKSQPRPPKGHFSGGKALPKLVLQRTATSDRKGSDCVDHRTKRATTCLDEGLLDQGHLLGEAVQAQVAAGYDDAVRLVEDALEVQEGLFGGDGGVFLN
jgi:hypothetical protein